MTNSSVSEQTRKFKMHPDLLFSVIQAQAGTAEKAILEAVMNAVDAGASKCEISLNENGFTIKDDGKGFTSQKEVDEFFETFGTPHKEGDATYGRFRMGRGQLFAFSATVWRTNTFEMRVDVKKTGLDYTFLTGLSPVVGCSIEGQWYDKLTSTQLFTTLKELEKLIKYMQIPVIVNGNNLAVNVATVAWTYQEPDFLIKVSNSASTLSVYNMGALVTHYPASRFGVGGTVVTRSALKVNFARNDVLVSQCGLWKKIIKKLQEVMGLETAKKTVLNQAQREAWLNSLISFEKPLYEAIGKGLIQDVCGKKISFSAVLDAKKLTISSGNYADKKKEERVNDSKVALVLASSVLDTFMVASAKELVSKINELIIFSNKALDAEISLRGPNYWQLYSKRVSVYAPDVISINDLTKAIKSDMVIKSDLKKLNKKEQVFLKALQAAASYLAWATAQKKIPTSCDYAKYKEIIAKHTRKILLGQSEVAHAWTDGKSYIAVDEKMVKQSPMTIINILLHEYCHTEQTGEAHDHSTEFYEMFHDLATGSARYVEQAIQAYITTYNKECLKQNIKPNANFDKQSALLNQFSSFEAAFLEELTEQEPAT